MENNSGRDSSEEGKSTRDRILEAAIDLFSQRGYIGVSIRDITRYVGIKESSLYNHFRSKDELMETIYVIFEEELGKKSFPEDHIEALMQGLSPEEFLIQDLINFKERLTPMLEKIWRIIYMEQFRDERARDFVLYELHRRPLRFYEKVFSLMISWGMIKPLNAAILAYQYNYPLTIMAMEYIILKYDNKDASAIGRQMVEHIKSFTDMIKV